MAMVGCLPMRVLLSDGSGLTARQVATHLADRGHRVEVLSPDPFCLARFTRRVRRVHRVPSLGEDPLGWLRRAVQLYATSGADVLFPTQEQVAVLSACRETVVGAGVRTVVPAFSALARVQDKIAAFATLEAAGLPQPDGTVLSRASDLAAWDRFPVYVKMPIGTASTGVRLVSDRRQAAEAAAGAEAAGAFGAGGVLVQAPLEGPLAMVQSVFSDGDLVAWHANLRVREGASGGASHKRSIDLPVAREHLEALGRRLRWHGALSMDAMLVGGDPFYIDVNPRLVEPANAFFAGVDLVGPMLELAQGGTPSAQPSGHAGVRTHQLLLAVLGAASRGGGRRAVVHELVAAARRADDYGDSREELTPIRGDLRAATPIFLAAGALLVRPSAWTVFTAGSVKSYSLSAEGWALLRRSVADRGPG